MNQRIVKLYAAKMAAESGRKTTKAEAENEITRIMQHVSRTLAPSYRFGYHTVQDIEHQGIIEALKVLNKVHRDTGEPVYDVTRPLENFLYTHVRNQLSNYRRKNYIRLEPPCSCCDPFNPPPNPCKKWRDWYGRNATKQNLMRPLDMGNISDEGESSMSHQSTIVQDAMTNELERIIDVRLPVELRSDYLRMRSQENIPKARRQRVREVVASIARDAGYLDSEDV